MTLISEPGKGILPELQQVVQICEKDSIKAKGHCSSHPLVLPCLLQAPQNLAAVSKEKVPLLS